MRRRSVSSSSFPLSAGSSAGSAGSSAGSARGRDAPKQCLARLQVRRLLGANVVNVVDGNEAVAEQLLGPVVDGEKSKYNDKVCRKMTKLTKKNK